MSCKKEVQHTFELYLQKKLLEHNCGNNFMDVHEARTFLTWYKIPKNLRDPILKEMEHLELIEFQNRFTIKIVNISKCKLIDNTSRLYKLVGLW